MRKSSETNNNGTANASAKLERDPSTNEREICFFRLSLSFSLEDEEDFE